ncbi:MAG: hypothetical protein IKD31_05370 [Clostridia bacterium]|nr:hypothetical protein [Clostridia bacterium]
MEETFAEVAVFTMARDSNIPFFNFKTFRNESKRIAPSKNAIPFTLFYSESFWEVWNPFFKKGSKIPGVRGGALQKGSKKRQEKKPPWGGGVSFPFGALAFLLGC